MLSKTADEKSLAVVRVFAFDKKRGGNCVRLFFSFIKKRVVTWLPLSLRFE